MSSEFLNLINNIKSCNYCEKKFGFKPNPVQHGNECAKILQISQAPSQNVYKTGKPFDDASGKKLIHGWYQIEEKDFYNKDNFYISAIAHCYPGKDKKGNDNKPPKECADKWLKQEIKLVNSKVIILIGSHSARYFFPDKNFTELVFNNQTLNNKPVFVLPHPSPLNIKWFKDNPDFELKRLKEIRKVIKEVLENSMNSRDAKDSKNLLAY